jgi:hypothetical protein
MNRSLIANCAVSMLGCLKLDVVRTASLSEAAQRSARWGTSSARTRSFELLMQ